MKRPSRRPSIPPVSTTPRPTSLRRIASILVDKPRWRGPGRRGGHARAARGRAQDRQSGPRTRFRHPGDLRRHPRPSDLEPARIGGDENSRRDREGPSTGPSRRPLDRHQRSPRHLRPEPMPPDLAQVLRPAPSTTSARRSASPATGRAEIEPQDAKDVKHRNSTKKGRVRTPTLGLDASTRSSNSLTRKEQTRSPLGRGGKLRFETFPFPFPKSGHPGTGPGTGSGSGSGSKWSLDGWLSAITTAAGTNSSATRSAMCLPIYCDVHWRSLR